MNRKSTSKTYHGDEIVKLFVNQKLSIDKRKYRKLFVGAISEIQKSGEKYFGRKLTISEVIKYMVLLCEGGKSKKPTKAEIEDTDELLYFVEVVEACCR